MQLLRQYISFTLLPLFGLVLIPGQYFHMLHGHDDTRCHPQKEAQFEPIHKHCKILQHQFSNY